MNLIATIKALLGMKAEERRTPAQDADRADADRALEAMTRRR